MRNLNYERGHQCRRDCDLVLELEARLLPDLIGAVPSESPSRHLGRNPIRSHYHGRIPVGLNPIAFDSTRTIMRSTQQFSITLPNEMADAVRAKVASGEYATESEVIREGLRALLARDRAIDDWLRKDVAAAYDTHKANPSRAVAVSDVKARLAAARKKVSAKA